MTHIRGPPGTVPGGVVPFPFSFWRFTVRILFINNQGAGYADHLEVEDGLTVSQLFVQQAKGSKAQDFLIRVNRLPASSDQVLQNGDRVSFTPTKIEGARTI